MLLIFAVCLFTAGFLPTDPPDGIYLHFKQRKMLLLHPMRNGKVNYLPRGRFSDRKLDTLSNWFDTTKNHVEIIRQDHPVRPTIGVALVFEFDEENGEYPYTPAYAVLQLKDFGWGGVEFDTQDTMNYTGVSNAVSNDLTVEILDFQNDTLTGKFSGVLLSGAGTMAPLDSGSFKIKVYRK